MIQNSYIFSILDIYTNGLINIFSIFKTDYYLPYSNSEDVDFTIFRPEGFGCFKWSTEDKYHDLVRLEAYVTDKNLKCGNRLLIQIQADKAKENEVDIILTGENVEETRREDVKVSFGDELEKILLTAVENGDIHFIQNIFRKEVWSIHLTSNIFHQEVLDRTAAEYRQEEIV